jgi:IclR family KDG regulon transcriptional repressor
MKTRSTHQSLRRGLQILETVAEMAEPPTLSQIARHTQLNRSTAHHILKALVDFGYLEQTPDALTYSLSSRLYRITQRNWTSEQLAEIAAPFLKDLSNLTGEGTSLAVMQEGAVTVAAAQEQDGLLRVVQRVGETRPFYCTAVGKVLAAGLPDQELEAILARTEFVAQTPKTIASAADFRKEVMRVRGRGVALDNEEHLRGVRCLAAPVRDYTGEVRAALGVLGPKDNLSPKRLKTMQTDLLAVAAGLSARLGYGDPT